MKDLHLFIVGISTLVSCIFLADCMDDLGLRNLMGDIPTYIFVVIAGLVMIRQSLQKQRKNRYKGAR